MIIRERIRSRVAFPRAAGQDTGGALGEVLGAFISSRVLIWVAGILTAVLLGLKSQPSSVEPISRFVRPFGHHLLNIVISPGARFDSAWFLSIAAHGYIHSVQTVFFPLYPTSVALLGLSHIPLVIAGVLLSCAFAVGALYLLLRLVELDQDSALARDTVWIVAWLPMALFLSAVYSEALFLLLAVGSIYAARRDRWWLAGILGCLAAATRNTGILLTVPLLMLYLYGPRAGPAAKEAQGRFRPRYPVRWDIAWVALVPLGLLAYLTYLHFATGHPLAPFTAERHWKRVFIPFGAIPLGIFQVGKSLVGIVPGLDPRLARHISAMKVIRHIAELAVLVAAVALLWFGRRRLPLAYTVFAALSLAAAVSVPAHGEPLKSLPRFTLVIFPLWISLALWARERRRLRAIFMISPLLLAAWTFLFVGWYWAG